MLSFSYAQKADWASISIPATCPRSICWCSLPPVPADASSLRERLLCEQLWMCDMFMQTKPPVAAGGGLLVFCQRAGEGWKGCELTWGRETEVVVKLKGWGWGEVAGDKGRQMGQTMGLRHPPCMSTSPSPLQTSPILHKK